MTRRVWPRAGVAVAAIATACCAACSSSTPAPPAGAAPVAVSNPSPGTRAVSLPDLSRVDKTVQEQARERYDDLMATLERPDATAADKGNAYGSLAMLLHAGEYYDAAEPAYLNAQDLMPEDHRWPYLLAQLHKSRGDPVRAMADLTKALELQPNDVPTLIWLGRLYLDQGQPEKAEPLFTRARTESPRTVAVLVGLGQSALARRDFARAATVLEEALEIDHGAASVHSPLAMAYRGLGDTAKAEAHLKQWRNTEVLFPDPVRQGLDLALQSGLSFELRGVRALEQRNFKMAAGFFRQGVDITPASTMLGRSLRHKLATALYLDGDIRGAVDRFEEVVRSAPTEGRDETAAKAHYSLGVLMASAGRANDAIRHLTAALSFNPNYLEASQALADALRRAGKTAAALPHYENILKLNPRAGDARFGYAMGLVRLKRYADAKAWLLEGTRLLPDDAQLKHALARILAAAPDDTVREGGRAVALVQELLPADNTTAMGETLAMAYAEVGNFEDAIGVQRSVIEAATRAGLSADVRRMTGNLRLYEKGQPCRTPWTDADGVFSPGPPVTPELTALLSRTPTAPRP